MKDFINKIGIKKILYLVIGIIVIVGVILLFSFIGNRLFSAGDYDDIENMMKKAAVSYYSDNKDKLPINDGGSVSITDSDLLEVGYMKKSISKYLKDDSVSCDGVVNVTNVNNNYRYVALLDCGESYKTTTFVDYLKENVDVVSEDNGLYSYDSSLVFRGDNVDNYVSFNGKTYRIVKVIDDKVMLIYDDEKIAAVSWDNRYNVDRGSNVGINDYSVSRIKDSLFDLYNGDTLFDSDSRLLLANFDLVFDKKKDTDGVGTSSSSNTLENQYIGLITLDDFMRASLDKNCVNPVSISCTNYNYLLDPERSYWTITADFDASYKVFKIDIGYGAMSSNASSTSAIKPVIYLSKDVLYVSGDGTINNPFIVK